jgi:hypothetical protein
MALSSLASLPFDPEKYDSRHDDEGGEDDKSDIQRR